MTNYMVFAGRKWEAITGKRGITWNHDSAILGVFQAETPEDACQAAAIKAGFAGTFFAVEGVPWGIDLYESDVKEYGTPREPADRLERLERLIERGMERLIPAAPAEDETEEDEKHA